MALAASGLVSNEVLGWFVVTVTTLRILAHIRSKQWLLTWLSAHVICGAVFYWMWYEKNHVTISMYANAASLFVVAPISWIVENSGMLNRVEWKQVKKIRMTQH